MILYTDTDLWKYLAEQKNKKIVVYGMGNGADKILDVCHSYGIEVSDFFASDGFVRGHSFHGKRVLSYSETKEKYGAENMIVLLSFASSLPNVLKTIYGVAAECELYAPDVPVCGENLFNAEFYAANKEKIDGVRDMLFDEESKRIYDCVINYKLSGRIDYLRDAESSKEEVYFDLLGAKNIKIAVDAGAYNGDTARELAAFAPPLKRIYALEPDRRNFRKLSEYAASEERFEVCATQSAAWSEDTTLVYDASGNRNAGVNPNAKKTQEVSAISIDSLLKNSCDKTDYIKYDVEGSERPALFGSAQTIKKDRPALLVSAYHRSEDIFALPLLIREIEPSYKLYLRRYRYVPAWDLNLLAIPKNDGEN